MAISLLKGVEMPKKILLGVYIPTFNRKSELKQCLDSFIPQLSKYNFPIFISDNGSTDGTQETVMAAKKKYKNIFYKKNPKNLGYGLNFVNVLKMGNTEFAWMFGDDDKIEDGAIDIIVKNLNKGVSFLQINSSIFNNDFSNVIQKNLISSYNDVVFSEGDYPQVLLNAPNGYAGFMAELIVKKELLDIELSKLNLKTAPLDFIHSILFFRAIIGKKGICISRAIVLIRAFNISYSGRPFKVWLSEYPKTLNLLAPEYQQDVIDKAKRIGASMLVTAAVKNRESADRVGLTLCKNYVSNADNLSLSAKIALLLLLKMPKSVIKSVIRPMLDAYIRRMQAPQNR